MIPEHTWCIDGEGGWVCSICDMKARSKNTLIRPCPLCGGPRSPRRHYCDNCMKDFYGRDAELAPVW